MAALLLILFIRPFICSFAFPLADAYLGACTVTVLLIQALTNGFPGPVRRNLLPLTLLTIISAMIAAMRRAPFHPADNALLNFCCGPLILCSVASLPGRGKKMVIATSIASALIISLLGFYQYAFGFFRLAEFLSSAAFFSPPLEEIIAAKRAFLPFVTPNALAGYLLMITPLLVMPGPGKLLLIPIAAAAALTQSFGAFASVITALLMAAHARSPHRKKMFFLGGITALLLIGIAIYRDHAGASVAASFIARAAYWKEALVSLGGENLLFGSGEPGIHNTLLAHNIWLQTMIDYGTITTVCLALLYLKTLRVLNPAGALCLSIFLIHNMVDFTFVLPEVAWISWALAGACVMNPVCPDQAAEPCRATHDTC